MNELGSLDMEVVLAILGVIGLAFLLLKLCVVSWHGRRLNKLVESSSEELRAIVSDPKKQHFVLHALEELKSRGEDLSFARPVVARMMSSPKRATRFFGHLVARTDFPDLIERFGYSWRSPSQQVTEWLRSIAAEDGGTT